MKPILTKTGSLPNLPWQERPADCTAPVWRYQENPIISRNPIWCGTHFQQRSHSV